MVTGPRSTRAAAALTVTLVALATLVYYLVPAPGRLSDAALWALIFAGVAVLGLAIWSAILRLMKAGEDARIRGLILLFTLTVLFFSWSDLAVSRLPGQFDDLHTKTDALYFNVSTLATVGFGDVHAAGQLARAAVTLQIVFNLVFLGAAVSVISGFFRTRARRSHQPQPGEPPSQAR